MARPPASEGVDRWIAVSEGAPPVPDRFTTEEERELWFIYCSARDPRDCRPGDLLTVERLEQERRPHKFNLTIPSGPMELLRIEVA